MGASRAAAIGVLGAVGFVLVAPSSACGRWYRALQERRRGQRGPFPPGTKAF